MLAVILAGGRGERLGNMTKFRPKPMMTIADKPFLLYKINSNIRQGINNFVICTGYMSEKIEGYFKDGRDLGCKIVYSREKSSLGTGGALKQALPFLEDEFLLLNGDNLNFIDLEAFINFFKGSSLPAAMAVCFNASVDRYKNNVTYDKLHHMVIDYNWSGRKGMEFVDTGVRCFRKDIFDYFPDKRKFSIEEEVFTLLAKKGKIAGYEISKPPLDIGTPKNLELTRETIVCDEYKQSRIS